MTAEISEVKDGSVLSKDGTRIGYKYLGAGPGLLIVHGGFRASQHYLALAKHLADTFTVYVMDRRGRNASGPKGEDYSIRKELDDIEAVLERNEIALLFGHSFGAFASLNVAMEYPLNKLAVYEPPVPSYLPIDWLPRFERELQQGRNVAGSITFLKGLKMGGWVGKLPKPILKLMFGMMARGAEWEENVRLIRTVPVEIRAALNWNFELERLGNIHSPALILYGTKTTDYLIRSAKDVARYIPDHQLIALDGLVHNAPDEQAPERIAEQLRTFFGE
jgi:pimeloyl-ACP methyl ester carboxylesterase